MSETPTVCPWCQTEIVWDEEVGPESVCPHCENELTGFRTINLDVDRDEEGYADDDGASRGVDKDDGFRHTSTHMLALEKQVERMLVDQEEVPECPSCREYMIEVGRQQAGGHGFEPVVHETVGTALLPQPFSFVWFVCPACFTVQNRLSGKDRDFMLKRLVSVK